MKNKIQKGLKINICRWDWNGVDVIEEVIEVEIINDSSAWVYTKHGKVKFDRSKENNAGRFKWKNKKKYSWESVYQTNIDLKEYYL